MRLAMSWGLLGTVWLLALAGCEPVDDGAATRAQDWSGDAAPPMRDAAAPADAAPPPHDAAAPADAAPPTGEVDAPVDAAPPTGDSAAPADAVVGDRRCGDDPNKYIFILTSEHLQAYADCTVLVGFLQADAVRDLPDLAALMNVRRIEGFLNIFRSPGFLSLHGLENLEVVEGNLYIHLNPNLTSIAALGKLRIVTGNLFIVGNDQLPQAEVDALGARVTVGGTKTLSYPPP